jgi:hypothetical protein
MSVKQQINGINEFLTMVYGTETRLSTMLTDLGFSTQQIKLIRDQYLEQAIASFLESLKKLMGTGVHGERLYQIVSRRFGLDSEPPDTVEALGQKLGISREQVQQLEYEAISKFKSKANQQLLKISLHSIALISVSAKPVQVRKSITSKQTPSKRGTKSSKRRSKSKSTKGWSGRDDFGDLPTGLIRHDPRSFTDSLPTCPHGVLKIRPCAICEPKRFQEETGGDF